MRTSSIRIAVALVAWALSSLVATAQDNKAPFLSTLRLEARADFEYDHTTLTDERHTLFLGQRIYDTVRDPYAFVGKYFNLHMGGNIGGKFSYYFRQRINANAGNIRFFDNTDFLYLNYQVTPNWSLRVGKDALAVGGFEYDQPPIDVMFNGYYWDMFYCFQIGASAAWSSGDGNHTVRAQVANSPYHHNGSPWGAHSLLGYNLLWAGKMGHFSTLYSVSLFGDGQSYMPYVALGNKVQYDHWSAYVDLIARRGMECRTILGQVEWAPADRWTLFAKGSYMYSSPDNVRDCLALPNQEEWYAGCGIFFRPAKSVRLHAFLAYYSNRYEYDPLDGISTMAYMGERTLRCNVGATWDINVLNAMRKHTSLID